MTETCITWVGKELEECTREELLSCLKFYEKSRMHFVELSNNKKIEALEIELKIKNDVIERLVSK